MKRAEQRLGIAVWDRPLAVRARGGPYRKLYALAHSVFASDGVNSTLHKSKPKLRDEVTFTGSLAELALGLTLKPRLSAVLNRCISESLVLKYEKNLS